MANIGIIGGSGLDNPDILQDAKDIQVSTAYGPATSPVRAGTIGTHNVFLIARHGREHTIPPSQVNYRANIMALKDLGCGSILTTKNVMNHLGDDDRKVIRYGIRKRAEDRELFVENVFSRVEDLLKGNDTWRQRFADIATLPVTEITEKKTAAPK